MRETVLAAVAAACHTPTEGATLTGLLAPTVPVLLRRAVCERCHVEQQGGIALGSGHLAVCRSPSSGATRLRRRRARLPTLQDAEGALR